MIEIFIDADDTILKSSETVIEILNKKYNLVPKKGFKDLTDWEYRSIAPFVTKEEIMKIYDSDEFFNMVKTNKEFDQLYSKYNGTVFHFNIVTKGTPENLIKKQKFFKQRYPDVRYFGLSNQINGEENFDKSSLNMLGGIQIDDRFDCLSHTNARRKLLLKNERDFYWNDTSQELIEDLYIANNWKDIQDFLDFTANNPQWIEL